MVIVKSKQKVVRRDQEQNMMKKVSRSRNYKDEAKREELKACLDIVLGDDIAMDFESLATKYPIINWKTYILTENMMYYQIIRANGSSKNYKMLDL
ncbi:hypothetical protein Tco_1560165 [Tanacetum coccineum]